MQQMLTRVRAEVVSSTKNKQVPWSNSSLLGEVYLAEK
ncbi:putative caspase-like protein [Bradyrhizobium japonicum]